jgi:hypothetical protein
MKSILALAAAALLLTAAPALARNHDPAPATTLAVIGDTPYGADQIAAFPSDIQQLNADPDVSLVLHLGDIKNGSSRCDDSYFSLIRSDFDTFADPLVYTPGDNEWTDCHRANNGGYLPTERLAKLREVFFDRPGHTLGDRSYPVDAQAPPYVENVRWARAQTLFATLDVPGSNNDLAPWFGAAETPEQAAQREQEYEGRLAADLEWLDQTFVAAERSGAAAVVIGLQADMWDPEAVAADATSGFDPIVAELAKRAHAFHRPVLLFEGDSHHYLVDHPLEHGSELHHVRTEAPNVTRIVVQGSTSTPHEWLKLRVDPSDPAVFSWQVIPFS